MTAALQERSGAGTVTTPPVSERPYRLRRWWRGPATDPGWARPALLLLLAATAALYLIDLSISGWANAFYSAAAQAGSVSWKAFFFGSSDSANAITVDKTPASVWFMALSARVFGVSSFAILLPQALMGVSSVGLLYTTVKRVAGAAAGVVAGAALALTPVAALMFRFNNPDALMVLGLVAAAWAMVRAIETGRTTWLVWCGVFVGIAFLAKMLQAFLVLPGLGVAYLVAGPWSLGKRIRQLLVSLLAMLIAGGWWVAVVAAWPAADRPFIGGSQSNSVFELLFGYNGFGRLTGNEVGNVGWTDQSSATKLISAEMGGQIAWLLPAAVIALGAGLWLRGRRPRTDRVRASLIIWGAWLLVTAVTFSAMHGIIHPYYTVALAPAISALVGIGGHELWVRRADPVPLGVLAGTVVVSGVWAKVLLDRTPTFVPWLGTAVVVGAFLAAAGLLAGALRPAGSGGRLAALSTVLAVVVLLAGPAAYTADTVSTAHTGALPSAGPSSGNGFSGGRGGFGAGAATTGTGGATGPAGPGGGGMGGLLGAPTPTSDVVATLQHNAAGYTWAAAVIGSNNAAGYQLATGLPVMAVGGFNGTDPSPTLAEFQQLVAAGRIHYFIAGTIGLRGNAATTTGSQDANAIAAWVSEHYPVTTVGSVTLYDLTPAGTT